LPMFPSMKLASLVAKYTSLSPRLISTSLIYRSPSDNGFDESRWWRCPDPSLACLLACLCIVQKLIATSFSRL
jgi:hypothetical protein